jgi:hypothetical protein
MGERTYPPFLASVLGGGEWPASLLGQFNPGENPMVPVGQEVEWTLEPVWALWSRENALALAGNQSQAVQFIAVLT